MFNSRHLPYARLTGVRLQEPLPSGGVSLVKYQTCLCIKELKDFSTMYFEHFYPQKSCNFEPSFVTSQQRLVLESFLAKGFL